MTDDLQPEANEPEVNEPNPRDAIESAEIAAEESEIEAASDSSPQAAPEGDAAADEDEPQPRPAPKLERLQKILAQAGVASRRSAEGMITEGRVQVNGKVVTELGTKADAGRDHIRVDGKLLHGAERLRYFMLNKPRGFVTTVKDPEGRSTVMQFFAKMPERLYPVGRLDYLSEGLLLVTNDGELANRLTKAASGVEKTYLVKVSGQPTESELDILRGGVAIERGKPGEGRVRTAPARIRQVRQGDNPWYEVVLIEGRNRELRKMFEEVGHFVEKIRRVGYGPLVLDVEPGNLRELTVDELTALRRVAEGKLQTPKAKDVRRRNALDAQLPTLRPRPSRPRAPMPAESQSASASRPDENRPAKPFGTGRPFRPTRPPGRDFRPTQDRGPARGPAAGSSRGAAPAKFAPGGAVDRPAARPAWKKDDRPGRPTGGLIGRPDWKKGPGGGRTSAARPAWNKPSGGNRGSFPRPAAPRREPPAAPEKFVEKKPSRLQIDPVEPGRPDTPRSDSFRPGAGRARPDRLSSPRPNAGGPRFERGASDRPRPERPKFDRPKFGGPRPERPRSDRPDRPRFERPDRPGGTGRTSAGPHGSSRPPRSGGLARPFTTSSGKPRAGGARPNNKPGKTTGRPYAAGSRPSTGAGAGPRPAGKTGWKPKPSFGGPGNPSSGARSKPSYGSKPSGAGKSGFKGKSAGPGAKRTGPRPGGKRPGGMKRG
jgi:23S rRNA pseudouridine2605 synthase